MITTSSFVAVDVVTASFTATTSTALRGFDGSELLTFDGEQISPFSS